MVKYKKQDSTVLFSRKCSIIRKRCKRWSGSLAATLPPNHWWDMGSPGAPAMPNHQINGKTSGGTTVSFIFAFSCYVIRLRLQRWIFFQLNLKPSIGQYGAFWNRLSEVTILSISRFRNWAYVSQIAVRRQYVHRCFPSISPVQNWPTSVRCCSQSLLSTRQCLPFCPSLLPHPTAYHKVDMIRYYEGYQSWAWLGSVGSVSWYFEHRN